MKLKLYNLSHDFAAPAAEDKPIFIPFGKWPYDEKISQTFTREAAEAISGKLAEDVAAGNPGIPVYQGHPDVPTLAAKYPDKGALGWVKKIDVADEGCYLTVEWDRFPGKGFGWFSPYWFGDKGGLDNEGKTVVNVEHIASIGLVNNPNISEFRLPNESAEDDAKHRFENKVREGSRNAALIKELADRRDVTVNLANVIDANGLSHSESDGRFDGGNGGGGATASKPSARRSSGKSTGSSLADGFNSQLKAAREKKDGAGIARAHMQALKAGLVWDKKRKGYRPRTEALYTPAAKAKVDADIKSRFGKNS